MESQGLVSVSETAGDGSPRQIQRERKFAGCLTRTETCACYPCCCCCFPIEGGVKALGILNAVGGICIILLLAFSEQQQRALEPFAEAFGIPLSVLLCINLIQNGVSICAGICAILAVEQKSARLAKWFFYVNLYMFVFALVYNLFTLAHQGGIEASMKKTYREKVEQQFAAMKESPTFANADSETLASLDAQKENTLAISDRVVSAGLSYMWLSLVFGLMYLFYLVYVSWSLSVKYEEASGSVSSRDARAMPVSFALVNRSGQAVAPFSAEPQSPQAGEGPPPSAPPFQVV
uniref:Uncharacterized protein n=1 Tax=Chromera velia CCMP2878 TaxID=1169474 RepID=A0A0G4FRL0_9ALVE|eukprot:Cvel_18415.t1-p1 / transcript=Cvel_18415.t1 / gene=Cvel_18415 / organism=Chromera_velia_CCMP2878 / gene_product=hypothetical protein / transcript_product=hypothetical protein / location=Cvel_scaffold1523:31656-32528(+) / protein_length=291 / sequence_SO=supercontig / SO=protein_coding / is_pseudo=false